jgi:hypothetical protein
MVTALPAVAKPDTSATRLPCGEMQQPIHWGVIIGEDRDIVLRDAIEDIGVRESFERKPHLALVFEASRPSHHLLFAEALLSLGSDDDDV